VNGRLDVQQISRHDFEAPGQLVSWLVAVQAQDYAAAKWALGLRLAGGATETSVERALSDGSILRTHALRWTWQFVAPADIRWLIDLVTPRLIARYGKRHRDLDLDEATFRKSNAVIEKALGDGSHLTRHELAARLSKARISPAGQRLAHILARAELEGLVCSGARRGKQSTNALLDLRVPKGKRRLAHDEALAELAERYFRSRGPATAGDFAWWSGLAPSDVRRGVEAARSRLISETIDGTIHFRGDGRPRSAAGKAAYLLPAFDEYLVAYRDRDSVLDSNHAKRVNAGGGMLGPCVVIGGRVVGTWRRVLARTTVAVDVQLFEKPTAVSKQSIRAAADAYAAFLGLEAKCRFA
jgi:hypothetical protein